MLSWRMLALFIHVVAVIVALGGSLFSTFVLTPVLARELEPVPRVRVVRRVIRRQAAVVLTALAVLVATGLVNLAYVGMVSQLLPLKLLLVVIAIGLAIFQYGRIGTAIWRASAAGPDPSIPGLAARFRRYGLAVGTIVLIVVYLSLGLTRTGPMLPPGFPG